MLAVRAIHWSSPEIPVSLSSRVILSRFMGSWISSCHGPTVRSVGSFGARREPWKACCSPSITIERPQSMISRFGYRAAPIPK